MPLPILNTFKGLSLLPDLGSLLSPFVALQGGNLNHAFVRGELMGLVLHWSWLDLCVYICAA